MHTTTTTTTTFIIILATLSRTALATPAGLGVLPGTVRLTSYSAALQSKMHDVSLGNYTTYGKLGCIRAPTALTTTVGLSNATNHVAADEANGYDLDLSNGVDGDMLQCNPGFIPEKLAIENFSSKGATLGSYSGFDIIPDTTCRAFNFTLVVHAQEPHFLTRVPLYTICCAALPHKCLRFNTADPAKVLVDTLPAVKNLASATQLLDFLFALEHEISVFPTGSSIQHDEEEEEDASADSEDADDDSDSADPDPADDDEDGDDQSGASKGKDGSDGSGSENDGADDDTANN
ncbi:unnamed protein product [Mycena citricolor]|uniref:Uncharacterized protein n=1 Tax=Mycena citricolor TaxID=2018698 RepID=A0AAD2HWG2_9AGAR|nr:unnamed protein product [Mycena citricolor]